jgi:predicted nuclease of predicted toxin-antitoxin system
MKLLIDMNLSPDWVKELEDSGWEAVHWQSIGEPDAKDSLILEWARNNGYTIFTHDLDFGTLLTYSQAQGPSVLQVRTQDVMPKVLKKRILQILHDYSDMIEKGALIVIDEHQSRIRLLPLS